GFGVDADSPRALERRRKSVLRRRRLGANKLAREDLRGWIAPPRTGSASFLRALDEFLPPICARRGTRSFNTLPDAFGRGLSGAGGNDGFLPRFAAGQVLLRRSERESLSRIRRLVARRARRRRARRRGAAGCRRRVISDAAVLGRSARRVEARLRLPIEGRSLHFGIDRG